MLLAVGAVLLATAECKKPRTPAEWKEISKKGEIKEREESRERMDQKTSNPSMVFVMIHPSPDKKAAEVIRVK